MIALSGYSRFPSFFTSDGKKGIGFKTNDNNFNEYVSRLRGKFVAIRSLKNLRFRSRFAVKGKAINPELETDEAVIQDLYVYPDEEPTNTITNALTLGISIQGGRGKVFVPLLCRRVLSRQEVDALLKIVDIKEFGLDRFKIFMTEIGIDFEIVREVVEGAVVRVNDPQLRNEYRVLIDEKGRILDVDFCVHGHEDMFLPELVMFARADGYINHIGGFHH